MKSRLITVLMLAIMASLIIGPATAYVNITNAGSAGGFTLTCPDAYGDSCTNLGCSGKRFNVTAGTDMVCTMTAMPYYGGGYPLLGPNFDPYCYVGTAPSCVEGGEYTIHTAEFGGSVSAYFHTYSPLQASTFYFDSTTYGPPDASFTATPQYGVAPLTVDFVDTSTGPKIDSWVWDFGDGSSVYGPGLGTTSNIYTGYGNYTATMTVTNTTYGSSNATKTIQVASPTGIRGWLDVKDSISGAYITDVSVGIKNTTSGAWRNSTLSNGAGYFDSTDPGFIYPLAIGQTIGLAATKAGYSSAYTETTIPYNDYHTVLYLTPDVYTPAGGNWNLVVTVKRNLDLAPIYGANVRLQTGVSPSYDVTQQTDSNGMTTFVNVTASTAAIWSVVSQQYQDTSGSISVITPNGTQHLNVEMVLKGATPVATPVTPHPTGTPYDPDAPGVYPTPTDASGNPITDSGSKGFAAFGLLIDAAYAIMGIVVGLIFIWLLWMTVYLVTGGKIIDKIMRRGRR